MLIGQKERSAEEMGEWERSKKREERGGGAGNATHQRHDTLPGNDNDKIN